MLKTGLALLKRELLEHSNIWRVPIVLIGIAVLVRLSLSIGNLSVNINFSEVLPVDRAVDSVLTSVIAKSLGSMNGLIMLVMFVVAVFYALSCLFNERQDNSVLFWRSLPVSDNMTVMSKLVTALLIVPIIAIICQLIVIVIFLGADSLHYLSHHYVSFLGLMLKVICWSLVPIVAWCLLCSEVANKNPFLLAFIVPILVVAVDKLFLKGLLSQSLIINRVTGVSEYTWASLVWGGLFSVACVMLAILKRSQRV